MAQINRTTSPGSSLGEQAETDDQRTQRLAYEADRIAMADASIKAGRVVPFAAIRAWADSLDTTNEVSPPAV